jgi:hypothetical protein
MVRARDERSLVGGKEEHGISDLALSAARFIICSAP